MKNVIIVGNSVEMMYHENGKFIDSHDAVIRLGRGYHTKGREKELGSKMDMWATGWLRSNHLKMIPNDVKILHNRMRINLLKNKVPKLGENFTTMFSDKELLTIMDEFGFKNNSEIGRPSNGFITLLYFLRKETNWKTLTIIGFDFFAKTLGFKCGEAYPFSWHLPENSIPNHPHFAEVERDAVLHYAETIPNFKWILLSDLKKEVIF